MLLGVVLGWTYPGWVSCLLVTAFVGGFGYLVATMPRGDDRGWPGDDGGPACDGRGRCNDLLEPWSTDSRRARQVGPSAPQRRTEESS